MSKNYLDGSLKSARRVLGVHVRGRVGKRARCMGSELSGQKFNNREAQRAGFRAASKACGG